MGFNASIPMGNTGVISKYQKVLSVNINDNLKMAEVEAIGYVDKKGREAGNEPLSVRKSAILSPREYDQIGGMPIPDDAESIRDVIMIVGYEILRLKVAEFENADIV
jgi:hypothetical protein